MDKPIENEAGQKRASSWKANLLLLFISILLGLLFAELAVRIYYRAGQKTIYQELAQQRAPNGTAFLLKDIIAPSSNSELVYELIANREGKFQGKPFSSNSHGMRSPEVSVAKPDGLWRLTTLGDSTMFGWGLRQGESYPAVLETALNAAGDERQYEVLNFAVPGYNTAIEAAIFEHRVRRFEPDMVLLQFDINDLALPNFIQKSPSLWTLKRSFLVTMMRGIIRGRGAKSELARIASGGLRHSPRIDAPAKDGVVKYFEYRAQFTPEQYRYMVGWDGVRRALDTLWDASEKPVLHLSWIYPASSRKVTDFGETDHFARYIKEAAAKREDGKRLHYLDIVSVGRAFCQQYNLRMSRDMIVNYPLDYHPSAIRHILFARMIYLYMVKERLLPKDSKHYEKSAEIAAMLWEKARKKAHRS